MIRVLDQRVNRKRALFALAFHAEEMKEIPDYVDRCFVRFEKLLPYSIEEGDCLGWALCTAGNELVCANPLAPVAVITPERIVERLNEYSNRLECVFQKPLVLLLEFYRNKKRTRNRSTEYTVKRRCE